jgi:hypothetical protein
MESLLVASGANEEDNYLFIRGSGTESAIFVRNLGRVLAHDSIIHKRIPLEAVCLENGIADAKEDEEEWYEKRKTSNGKEEKRIKTCADSKP